MLERDAYKRLLKWKQEMPTKALLVDGARQIGKTYKRHVALNNLLGVKDYGVQEAYVLSEANVSTEKRAGKPVHYIPLYLTSFLLERLVADQIDSDDELERLGLDAGSMLVAPPDFSDFSEIHT